MKCPGQDTQYWKAGAIFDVPCPECGRDVEFFKDDTTRKCGGCGHVCNTMDHVQHLDEDRLVRFFPGAELVESRLIGEVPGYAPDWLYRAANRLGNSWEPLIYLPDCPACRATAGPARENPLGWALRRVIWRLERRAPRKPAWVLALFRVGGNDPGS